VKISRSLIQTIALLVGLTFLVGSILFINVLVTVPGTQTSYQLAALFSNFVFAMELGFSLPFPKVLGPILWLFLTWLIYFLVNKMLTYFFT
jgi:hypothetical protein